MKEDPLLPVMVRPHMHFSAKAFGPQDQLSYDHLSRTYSDFRLLEASELPEGVLHGGTYSTLCIDVPRYLPYLLNRFLASGGRTFRAMLPSLTALLSETERPTIEPFPPTSNSGSTAPTFAPGAVINCTGMGALTIGDVLDDAVYPTRGEVLIVRAPWIHNDSTYHFADGHVTYVIARQSGDVILGGTRQADDWHPIPRPETVKLIKERGIAVFPELLPENKRDSRKVEDLDVREECVGLRPSRRGGIRLEAENLAVGDKSIPIVHNYGYGGAGYMSSWASAAHAVNVLKSVIN
ncbi:hypothetical protein DFH06DRAFT_1087553 [Mycena polygramma]|nr:hypothetical protein DFH06DRAFT_1087553 [Mycena polygramma]